jgi:hypothetical protein
MMYRYHTGYPGKLHEIPMETMLQKHPEEVIHHAVSKMLPKNRNRPFLFKKFLIVHAGPVHNQQNLKLPQFTVPLPHDINKTFQMADFLDKDKAQIEWMSTDQVPEELQAHEKAINEETGIISHLAYKKQYTIPKENMAMAKYIDRSYIKARRYKMHKRL